ncbi:MAG: sugar transferase [Thermoanaerobaculia bacterium]
MDLVISVPLCVLSWPVLLLCGAMIRLETKGSVFFRQERIGRGRKPFEIIKLRTMVENAESLGAGLYAVENDPRFTRVGLWLRRFSLDELPQVVNVVAGDMSIVGPRPLPASIVDQYAEQFHVILDVKPGITGLSQVSGRNQLPRGRRLELDMSYARECNFALDVWILLQTTWVVLTGAGQENYQGRGDVER